jgi:hypothetical protein
MGGRRIASSVKTKGCLDGFRDPSNGIGHVAFSGRSRNYWLLTRMSGSAATATLLRESNMSGSGPEHAIQTESE